MKYKHRILTNKISLIYGFDENSPRYVLIATLHKKFNKTKIYGLLTRKNLKIDEFISFWQFLKKIVKTRFIQFEVISSDARVYKKFFTTTQVKSIKTFNNYEAEQITIDKNQKIRIIKDKS